MFIIVHNVAELQGAHYINHLGENVLFDNGKEAAEYCEQARINWGIKVRPDLVQEDENWRAVLEAKFTSGEWKKMPEFFPEKEDTFLHVSVHDESRVAYVPDEKFGKTGKTRSCSPGRYLANCFSNTMSETERSAMSSRYLAHCEGWEFQKATNDPDEFLWVYTHCEEGAQACMCRGEGGYSGDGHPVTLYADSDFSLIYLTDGDTVFGRAIVDDVRKRYVSIYGRSDIMRKHLADEGYHSADTQRGAKMRIHLVIDDDYAHFKLPYIDGGTHGNMTPDGQYFIINQHDNKIQVGSDSGVTHSFYYPKCRGCQKRTMTYHNVRTKHSNNQQPICLECVKKDVAEGNIVKHDGELCDKDSVKTIVDNLGLKRTVWFDYESRGNSGCPTCSVNIMNGVGFPAYANDTGQRIVFCSESCMQTNPHADNLTAVAG